MMSNNFVELKGSVFKKFGKNNLYQMSCSDVRERFHYCVLLSIVMLRNMTEFNWNFDHFWELLPDVVTVLVAEVCVDWVKHAFITKFNEIPADVYEEYRASLAQDMISSKQENAFSDHSDLISRRMGFIPLPLGCLLYRTVNQSIRVPSHMIGLIVLVLTYLCMISFKVFNSIVLFGKACEYVNVAKKPEHGRSQSASGTPTDSSSREVHHVESLHCRTTLYTNSSVSLLNVDRDELSSSTPLNTLPEKETHEDKPKESLSDIDRYTLCSSHIV